MNTTTKAAKHTCQTLRSNLKATQMLEDMFSQKRSQGSSHVKRTIQTSLELLEFHLLATEVILQESLKQTLTDTSPAEFSSKTSWRKPDNAMERKQAVLSAPAQSAKPVITEMVKNARYKFLSNRDCVPVKEVNFLANLVWGHQNRSLRRRKL